MEAKRLLGLPTSATLESLGKIIQGEIIRWNCSLVGKANVFDCGKRDEWKISNERNSLLGIYFIELCIVPLEVETGEHDLSTMVGTEATFQRIIGTGFNSSREGIEICQ